MKLPTHDPLKAIQAISSDVNHIKETMERKPITIRGHEYDCKAVDLERMEFVGSVSMEKHLTWTLADNSTVDMTGCALLSVRDDIIIALGIRIGQLHRVSKQFKAKKGLTLRDIQQDKWTDKLRTLSSGTG